MRYFTGMKSHTKYLTLNIPSHMAFQNITPQVAKAVSWAAAEIELTDEEMAGALGGLFQGLTQTHDILIDSS